MIRVRFQIIGNARIENVGKSQSCMVSKLRIVWKQTVIEEQTRSSATGSVVMIAANGHVEHGNKQRQKHYSRTHQIQSYGHETATHPIVDCMLIHHHRQYHHRRVYSVVSVPSRPA